MLGNGEPGLTGVAVGAGGLDDAVRDDGFAVWLQPAVTATRTTASVAKRATRNVRADIQITCSEADRVSGSGVTAVAQAMAVERVSRPGH